MTDSTCPAPAPARPRRAPPRSVEVVRTTRLTPHLVRVTFGGAGLVGFDPGSPSSYVKLFLPAEGEVDVALPTFGPNGTEFPDGASRPTVRTYTPRAYDAVANELDVDFVLHGEGPASTWAAAAGPGDRAGVAGPGRGYDPDPAAAWFVIAGDEAALPAIATIAEALPAGITAHIVVEIPEDADRIDLTSPGRLITTWLPRGDQEPGAALEAEVRRLHLPSGDGRVWVATESVVVRRIRHHLLVDRGLDPSQVVVRGYWKAGDRDHPDQDYGDE